MQRHVGTLRHRALLILGLQLVRLDFTGQAGGRGVAQFGAWLGY
ncbi:hypothetical protein [Streptomyces aurantiacus]|nr:hypothetical protein [Streptomyces aurantiacus]